MQVIRFAAPMIGPAMIAVKTIKTPKIPPVHFQNEIFERVDKEGRGSLLKAIKRIKAVTAPTEKEAKAENKGLEMACLSWALTPACDIEAIPARNAITK